MTKSLWFKELRDILQAGAATMLQDHDGFHFYLSEAAAFDIRILFNPERKGDQTNYPWGLDLRVGWRGYDLIYMEKRIAISYHRVVYEGPRPTPEGFALVIFAELVAFEQGVRP